MPRPYARRHQKGIRDREKQKKFPSCLHVHIALGGTGSTTTIDKLRREARKLPPLRPQKKGRAIAAGRERQRRGENRGLFSELF